METIIMDRETLKDVIIDQHARYTTKKLIVRDVIARLSNYHKSSQVIIISGLRRCGKSTVLEQIRRQNSEQDFFLNFDDDRLVQFTLNDFQMLYELMIELYGSQKTFYFDEIQNINGWERFIRRLHDDGNKIYLTGSNAAMLSAELGTRLTGRYIEINLYPFSFREFLNFHEQDKFITAPFTTENKGIIKRELQAFFILGGLPGYLELPQAEYLHSIYESILYRDIIVRHKISNHKAIKELGYYLASNLSKECTYNALKNIIAVASPSTASDYCAYLAESFLCFFINRFDFSLKKQMASPKKIYFIDQALAINIGFRFSRDEGRVLENIVFLELKRRGYEIFYHKNTKECDFIIRVGFEVVAAIQVCVNLNDAKTEERELAGLLEAMQAYNLNSGLIITLDTQAQYKGNITAIPIWRWLLDTESTNSASKNQRD